MKIFGRTWRVVVGDVEFDGLDIEFDVYKSLDPEPNTAALTIYGLHEKHRKAMESLNLYDPKKTKQTTAAGEEYGAHHSASADGISIRGSAGGRKKAARGPKKGNIPVQLEVGIGDVKGVLFGGNMRRGATERSGAEVIFKLEGEDGGTAHRTTRTKRSYPPGTPRLTVVKDLAADMGLGVGNLATVASLLSGSYEYGTSCTGQASRLLTGILRGAGIGYSIQDGALQFRHPKIRTGFEVGYVLSPDSGLFGSPQKDATGSVMAECALLPGMFPGGLVQIENAENAGTYQIRNLRAVGSTFGDEWTYKLELVP